MTRAFVDEKALDTATVGIGLQTPQQRDSPGVVVRQPCVRSVVIQVRRFDCRAHVHEVYLMEWWIGRPNESSHRDRTRLVREWKPREAGLQA